jgi:hypothetical protein
MRYHGVSVVGRQRLELRMAPHKFREWFSQQLIHAVFVELRADFRLRPPCSLGIAGQTNNLFGFYLPVARADDNLIEFDAESRPVFPQRAGLALTHRRETVVVVGEE